MKLLKKINGLDYVKYYLNNKIVNSGIGLYCWKSPLLKTLGLCITILHS